jgi:hypothetical protein
MNTYMLLSCLWTVGIDSNHASMSITMGFRRTRGAQATTTVASEVNNKARAAQIRGCCSEEKVYMRWRAARARLHALAGRTAATWANAESNQRVQRAGSRCVQQGRTAGAGGRRWLALQETPKFSWAKSPRK